MQETVEYAEIVKGPTIKRAKTEKTSVQIESQKNHPQISGKKWFARERILKVVLIILALLGNALIVYFLVAAKVGEAEGRLTNVINSQQQPNFTECTQQTSNNDDLQRQVANELNQAKQNLTRITDNNKKTLKENEYLKKRIERLERPASLTELPNRNLYHFSYPHSSSWGEAKEYCEKKGLHLANLKTQTDLEAVYKKANK
ncbi:uncharacterized protein LOC132193909 isoform X1 [Neocloeon triangulifer]|uniref:uncharacterized protein LOC132193909 isoform X1 n=1 Tax=Neocloeon triangulifer TaxID=2078957 RepID=UPI00286F19C7|nr:uncharacterized protein LOC132193909 isoform X1 [Neocloeon triangulifer]